MKNIVYGIGLFILSQLKIESENYANITCVAVGALMMIVGYYQKEK